MNIYRKTMPNGKPSPTYYVRYQLDGKVYYKSTGCTVKKDAEKWATDLIDKLKQQSSAKGLVENFRDILAGGRVVLLTDAFGKFVKKPKRKPIGDRQMSYHKTRWNDFLQFMEKEYPAARKLSDVTPEMAEGYILYIRENGRFNKEISYKLKGKRKAIRFSSPDKLSARGSNLYHATCSQIFDSLFRDASLIENPFKLIPKLTHKAVKRQAFTIEELKLIKKEADPFMYPLFCVGMNTGMREGDICLLKWDEVDLNSGWIKRVMRKSSRMQNSDEITFIPILPGLKKYLARLERTDDYVFPNHAELYQESRTLIGWRVTQFLDRIGIENKSNASDGRSRMTSTKDIHSLRHTFCYLAIINGIPLPIIQSIVGHVDPEVTRLYTQHATNEIKKIKMRYMPVIFD